MYATLQDRSEIAERPMCGRCTMPMWLEKVVDAAPAHEVRTFKCPVCDMIAVREVAFGLAVVRAPAQRAPGRPPYDER